MPSKSGRAQILKEAWIGDAVLTLYARRRILSEDARIDAPKAERMTSNQFLSVFKEASETEAEIGRIYEHRGLDAAFAWIESNLMPIHLRQEAKLRRRNRRPDVV